jgi:hypothetical protein
MKTEYKDAWLKKYYPVDAKEFLGRLDRLDEALQHSLQKWKGLKEAARDFEDPFLGLELSGLIDVDLTSCALC